MLGSKLLYGSSAVWQEKMVGSHMPTGGISKSFYARSVAPLCGARFALFRFVRFVVVRSFRGFSSFCCCRRLSAVKHLYVFFCFRLMCSSGMPIVRYRVVLTLSVLDTGTVRTLSHNASRWCSTAPTRISYAPCAHTPQIIIRQMHAGSTEMLPYNM